MKAKIAKGGDDKQKQDGTEEEKKLQAKYELLRKKRVRCYAFVTSTRSRRIDFKFTHPFSARAGGEKEAAGEPGSSAGEFTLLHFVYRRFELPTEISCCERVQDDAAGAAAAADAQPAAAAQEPVAAPTAPAAAAAAEKPAAAAAAAKQVAKEAAPAAKPAPTTKTQLAVRHQPARLLQTAARGYRQCVHGCASDACALGAAPCIAVDASKVIISFHDTDDSKQAGLPCLSARPAPPLRRRSSPPPRPRRASPSPGLFSAPRAAPRWSRPQRGRGREAPELLCRGERAHLCATARLACHHGDRVAPCAPPRYTSLPGPQKAKQKGCCAALLTCRCRLALLSTPPLLPQASRRSAPRDPVREGDPRIRCGRRTPVRGRGGGQEAPGAAAAGDGAKEAPGASFLLIILCPCCCWRSCVTREERPTMKLPRLAVLLRSSTQSAASCGVLGEMLNRSNSPPENNLLMLR